MAFMTFTDAVDLWSLATAKNYKNPQTFADCTRAYARRRGYSVGPWGIANKKTGVPGTYRPVGKTCPQECPYLDNGCYAQYHWVGSTERRATSSAWICATALGLAMICAHKFNMGAVRLHVSGDFYLNGGFDAEYLHAVEATLVHLRKHGIDVPCFSYTHIEDIKETPVFQRWLSLGLYVRQSDHLGEWGAVVWPFDKIDILRQAHPEYQIAKCPAQLTHNSYQCKDCRLCWERPDVVIAFNPHGADHRLLRLRVLEGV